MTGSMDGSGDLPFGLCVSLITYVRLLFQADMMHGNLQDRLHGIPEQQLLVNKRSRQVQAETDAEARKVMEGKKIAAA
eukprot:m.214577 g.214577  ORF g.214577 m.214577 type:complete len:78 (-) comp16965_c0_seq7:1879-2112(-)